MKTIFITLFASVFKLSVAQNCVDLPLSFSNHKSALEAIKSTHFDLIDHCDTSDSSWIKKASFHSCDGGNGYFILVTNSNTYIHANLPKSIWEKFKETDSFGRFYNSNIKRKYQLRI